MSTIINDDDTVARAHISLRVLQKFLKSSDHDFQEHKKALSVKNGVVACHVNKIRIKKLAGDGWYQLSGYRSDGSDLQIALAQLRQVAKEVELSERVFKNAAVGFGPRAAI